VSEGGLAPTFSFEGEGQAVDAEALVRPVIEGAGLDLVEVAFVRENGQRTLRVIVDRPGGVDLDTLGEISDRVSRGLEGFESGGAYVLEVSSPGIERPLRRQEDFRRAVGAQVKVKTTVPVAGSRSHTGTLQSADDEGITLTVAGDELRVAHADIESARTVADWDAELKRSNA
jgi:ribosome maturation factor RimP